MKQNLQQIKNAKSGDTEAFAELYREIHMDLYRFALYTLKHPDDAEDAVSETVMDAFASISRLRSEDSFRAWIFKILTVKCKKILKRSPAMTDEFLINIPAEDTAASLEELMDLRNCFFRLDDNERLIISMHIFAGYTNREIAKILHMNANTVRSKESRALKKLSAWLSENEKER